MGVLPIVLIIVAMKIPILGLWALVWWAKQEPKVEYGDEGTDAVRAQPPREPEPADSRRGPRRRGPHGGAARPLPNRRRESPANAPTRRPEPLRSR